MVAVERLQEELAVAAIRRREPVERRREVRAQDVEVAHRAELAPEPAQLARSGRTRSSPSARRASRSAERRRRTATRMSWRSSGSRPRRVPGSWSRRASRCPRRYAITCAAASPLASSGARTGSPSACASFERPSVGWAPAPRRRETRALEVVRVAVDELDLDLAEGERVGAVADDGDLVEDDRGELAARLVDVDAASGRVEARDRPQLTAGGQSAQEGVRLVRRLELLACRPAELEPALCVGQLELPVARPVLDPVTERDAVREQPAIDRVEIGRGQVAVDPPLLRAERRELEVVTRPKLCLAFDARRHGWHRRRLRARARRSARTPGGRPRRVPRDDERRRRPARRPDRPRGLPASGS